MCIEISYFPPRQPSIFSFKVLAPQINSEVCLRSFTGERICVKESSNIQTFINWILLNRLNQRRESLNQLNYRIEGIMKKSNQAEVSTCPVVSSSAFTFFLPYFLTNFSTRPALSTSFCLPVKYGWQSEQISTLIWGTVEILRRVSRKERQLVTEPRPVAIAPQTPASD